MAYGVDSEIIMMIGGLTETMTSANVTIAITISDRYVDLINSNADSDAKTQASNEIAANILLWSSQNDQNEGLQSVGSTQGTPQKTSAKPFHMDSFVTDNIIKLLNRGQGQSRTLYITQDQELS